ncbi:hypothetical protein ABL78_1184 [Leptomonas seymouri]|uniref:Transmembrane protein n=1 Tax=Leptomonas seymouri TaxID=5684 RepID=A0A0N1PDT7_LEPSE|nr:hypothetical protein ABL78_1184 [Leptomonas seymouri]|eukprot:KPI89691.1 hypothetical protein ABL78_1184 [Leptomonas seymouri]
MRYRQSNQQLQSSDQQAKELIRRDDALSTREQEEVIAYFARSLQTSGQFLKVVVCLHALVALVYLLLLLSGSLILDLEVDQAATAKLLEVVRQQRQMSTITTTTTPSPASPSEPPLTQDPLAVLAALDVQQRAANRKYAQDYLERRSGSFFSKLATTTNVMPVVVTLYSVCLLLWAAWSGYMACRLLRVNVEDLTSTEPRELGTHPAASLSRNNESAVHTSPRADDVKRATAARSMRAKLQWLRQRVHTDPPVAQYAIAALASVASLFWLCALLRRQLAMRSAYTEAGLPSPSVLAARSVTDAFLEYVLAAWQPLFHLAIGRLVRSMLDTKENLVMLSKMKYRFDKV